MRGGVLIIGSLFWEEKRERGNWRRARLDMSRAKLITVSIHYGRRSTSRANTFTMVFTPERARGQAIVVPFKNQSANVDCVIAEAQALWKAEQPATAPGQINAEWGCVGLLLRDTASQSELAASWSRFFRANAMPISPTNENGLLEFPWPNDVYGRPIALDFLLATATKRERVWPTAKHVADSWCDQSKGYEEYFLQNVRCGIRTSEDNLIWARIEERQPNWLTSDAYADAIATLRNKATAR